MDVIVPLCVLSPVLMQMVKWSPIVALTLVFALSGVPVVFFRWSAPFVFGMICAQSDIFCYVRDGLAGRRKWCVIVLAVICFYLRKDLVLDSFLAGVFIVAIFIMCDIGWIRSSLSFVGKHSMNIFYTHTFYRSVWFDRDLFSNCDPAIAFALLLGVSLVTSFALNLVKGIFRRHGLGLWYNNKNMTLSI